MNAFWTILMLLASNVFMTFAWYGHLKLSEMKISTGWPLIVMFVFKGQALQWNHLAAFVCLVLAVFFVFLK